MAWDEDRARQILAVLASEDDSLLDAAMAKLADDLDMAVDDVADADLSDEEADRLIEYLAEIAENNDSLVAAMEQQMEEEGFSADEDDEDIIEDEEDIIEDDEDIIEDEEDIIEDDEVEEARPKTALAKLVASYKY